MEESTIIYKRSFVFKTNLLGLVIFRLSKIIYNNIKFQQLLSNKIMELNAFVEFINVFIVYNL